jgi:hypothetical protein
MTANLQSANSPSDIEATLRSQLAGGDAVVQTISPIIKHLLANGNNTVFSDDLIASTRGMVIDLAKQLLEALRAARNESEPADQSDESVVAITEKLIENSALLTHVHSLALEWQLTQRLRSRLALDSVLPPLLQNLMAHDDPDIAALAMHILAAQSRFCQAQRRMQLPLYELPGELLHGGLVALRSIAGDASDTAVTKVESAARLKFDESTTRIGLISRMLVSLGGNAGTALSVSHAGVAMFINALALHSGQQRDAMAIALNDSQAARLALALRTSGLRQQDFEAQFYAIHPEMTLPAGFEQLSPDRAAAILWAARQIGGN